MCTCHIPASASLAVPTTPVHSGARLLGVQSGRVGRTGPAACSAPLLTQVAPSTRKNRLRGQRSHFSATLLAWVDLQYKGRVPTGHMLGSWLVERRGVQCNS